MAKAEKPAKEKKPILKRWWFWVFVVLLLLYIIIIIIPTPESEDSSSSSTPEITTEPTEKPLRVNTGEILDVKENGDTLIVKARVNQLLNNKQTIEQNYFNACELIRSYNGDCTKLDYWAVTPQSENSDVKIMSFVVPTNTFKTIKAQDFPDITLVNYVTDLWILPSLQD